MNLIKIQLGNTVLGVKCMFLHCAKEDRERVVLYHGDNFLEYGDVGHRLVIALKDNRIAKSGYLFIYSTGVCSLVTY